MKRRLFEATELLRSSTLETLIKLSQGELALVWDGTLFRITDEFDESSLVLFLGSENWLESHVPVQEREHEAIRDYLIVYTKEMYKYETEGWDW